MEAAGIRFAVINGPSSMSFMVPGLYRRCFTNPYRPDTPRRYHSFPIPAILNVMRTVVASVCLVVFGATGSLFAQDAAAAGKAASPYVSVIGTVTKAEAAGKILTVKADKGDESTVKFDE